MTGRPFVVCAPDKLRGSLSAEEAAGALAEGARLAGFATVEHPLADGGEGTRALIVAARGGRNVSVETVDALGRPRVAPLGLLRDGTAVVEAADAIGLALLEAAERDPFEGSSLGIAPLMLAALDRGATRLIVCLGGSATVDGGLGLLRGLGARLLDESGRELCGRGRDLAALAAIDRGGLDSRLATTPIEIALDVSSPLFGPDGAATVFGPQKGASPGQVVILDQGLERLAALFGAAAATEGAGAAGGIAAALAYVGGVGRPGAATVMEATGFRRHLTGAALCLTAEGRVDSQTATGKTAARVIDVCVELGVPCVVIGGAIVGGREALYARGATAVIAASSGPGTLAAAMEAARDELVNAARAVTSIAALAT